jgi:hypothetical protein
MPLDVQFIQEFHNALTPEFCEGIIERFESDERTFEGYLGNPPRVDKTIKKSRDLFISGLTDYQEEDAVFHGSLEEHLPTYLESVLIPINFSAFGGGDTGYQIQKTDPGGFYIWHTDQSETVDSFGRLRLLTFIWYLNTIAVEDDGYTEFWDGTRIQPEQGKLLIFPATWTYAHRGYPPKATKYICTGWILSNVLSNELPLLF